LLIDAAKRHAIEQLDPYFGCLAHAATPVSPSS
jgi:hypothetical protein